MSVFTAVLSVLLVALHHKSVYAQNKNSPCYSGVLPLRCEPVFSNPAFGLPIEATNTCGEQVLNDADGRIYSRRKQESFKRFYRQTGATGATKYRDHCEVNTVKSHPPQNMVDLDAGPNRTWWQSITLYEYKERSLGDMVEASITLHLGKAYDITYIRLKFHSPRPESFSIWKKTSDSSDWEPYQYYSASCLSTYNLPQDGVIDEPTRAICTGEYSDISPLSGGNVAFSTLDSRPMAYKFDRNKLLQQFVTATALQIRLKRLNTFGDEVFEDTSVLQSYYYALSDISVGGKCKCNGHANQCVPSSTLDGVVSQVCQCQHNTTGPDCGQCLRTHNDRPWAPATILDANPCKECNCNERSGLCYFNQTLYEQTGSGGYCQDCRDFTAGPRCEKCRPNYFRRDPNDVCSSCNCDETGSQSQQCDNYGQCRCKPGVAGEKCDRCAANYYDFGIYGCRPCDCFEAGSFENTLFCDSTNGQCTCKANVEGQQCSTCKPGYFNLHKDNKFGCIACFCNGKTSECSSATGYVTVILDSYFERGNEGWTAVNNRLAGNVPTSFNAIIEDLAVSSDESTGTEIYFNAPTRFLGDKKYSYNQFLEFTLRTGSSQGRPSQRDIILEGNGRSVYLPIFAQGNPAPNLQAQPYRFRLNENPFYQWSPRLSALEFQRLLSNLTAIQIRGTYNRNGTGFLDDFKLYTAQNGQQIGDISSVESCVCPAQYIGQNCESCAPGYRRETPFGGRASECVPCECNGHSDTCDAESGACICQHETIGHNCEKCKDGWYGNAADGTPDDCTACPCPEQGPCYEQLEGSVSCLNCPAGYSGDLCDMCEDGYYMDIDMGGKCIQCDCSGNIDANAIGNCESINGTCQKCIHNTDGDHCDNCMSGFYGNATADIKGDCEACECNTFGTDPDQLDVCELADGQCSCLPYVTGRQCDQCESGYFNLESATGCEPCLCDATGSSSTNCDLETGQCSCKEGISGLRCDDCIADFFGFSKEGCDACNCLAIGSANGQCDESGQCECKDSSRITGLYCDTCHENKHNLTAGCPDCPACYNLVQDAVEDIRRSLLDLATSLKNIHENPNVADDAEFTNQLKALEDEVNDLLKEALNLQNSGGPASDDLEEVSSQILNLQGKSLLIQTIVAATQQKYDGLDLHILDGRIRDVTEEIAAARITFSDESSKLYSAILAALGKNGPKSESRNMTALAQLTTTITQQQAMDTEMMSETAESANEIAGVAYRQVVQVIADPGKLKMKLDELQTRIGDGKLLQEAVHVEAKKALEKATLVHKKAIESLNDAERADVPDIDTGLRVEEAKAILELAESQMNQTTSLLEQYGSVINETAASLMEAERVYNQTYTAQQVTDDMMAEVDLALEKALEAIEESEKLLATAEEQLRMLLQFDKNVKESKARALEAWKLIPEIEALLDEADNETSRASETVEGAKQATTEAKKTALEAKFTANDASKNAADILAEAKQAKMAADEQSSKTDNHEAKLIAVNMTINELEPREMAEKELIEEVLTEAERAKQQASQYSNQLLQAKEQVDKIINSLAGIPYLNTTELDSLEQEMNRLENEFTLANIDIQLKDLEGFNNVQRHQANIYTNSLVQLKEDVANIESIVNSIPKPPFCYKKPVLEKAADGAKKRRRQRKLRKRLRH